MADNPLDRVLSPFTMKGALVKPMEMVRVSEHMREGKFDIMEREFRPYKLTGNRDPNSGAELQGDEEKFMEVGREARDTRLVGMKGGQVAIAAGSLREGTGILYDMNGRPIVGNVPQAPVARPRRSPKDW